MPGTHKYPTISFRISDYERREIDAKVKASGMLKKDYFVRSCIYNRVYPERYRCLVRFGELSERASQVNETAYELLEDIEVRWLRKHKPKNPNSFVEQLHLRNQARVMAEEVVLVDVVRQFH